MTLIKTTVLWNAFYSITYKMIKLCVSDCLKVKSAPAESQHHLL